MSPQSRRHNDALRALIREARWTNHNFAAAVNRVAAEAGLTFHYDRTAVSHWLSGSRPRPPVPTLVAEAMSRRLGRHIAVAETGMTDSPVVGTALVEETSGVQGLRQLVLADLDPVRRTLLREQPFRADWAVAPEWSSARTVRLADLSPIERGAWAAVEAMTSAFAAAGEAFGGGHARLALAAYLATDVTPRLQLSRTEPPPPVSLSATAGLTRLLGFMCFDSLYHHLAQRYYRVALHLMSEAGDAVGQAAVLGSMSSQARFLGRHRQMILLADTAVARAGSSTPPGTRAALLGQAAVAHATLSERDKALVQLTEAERHLDETGVDVTGSKAEHAHRAGQVLALLGDHHGAERAWRESLRQSPGTQRRSRILTTHQLAELHFQQGRLELACETWQGFLDEYPYIRSARVDFTFQKFRRQLESHAENASVRRVLKQADQLGV
ncbi:tetratricopeptide repeat protein [Actinokineospora pegani]|uniref:tetratricopeptide repeat protein n=1 Tax=Actinokineospora pegani TaxID=2654637 RepID=UPI0012E9EB3F|nr:tetratricopeptide repeat protein [Actinokineospora pegani]